MRILWRIRYLCWVRADSADGIRKEREALLGQLQHGTEGLGGLQERTLLRRVCRSFTGAEIRDLSEGRGPLLAHLPHGGARTRVPETVLKLHGDATYPEASPWRGRHGALARTAGLERHVERERERYLGAEIEMCRDPVDSRPTGPRSGQGVRIREVPSTSAAIWPAIVRSLPLRRKTRLKP